MKTRVDEDTCIGCGICASICPKVYEINDDSKAYVIKPDVSEELESEVKDAENSCPVNAIELF